MDLSERSKLKWPSFGGDLLTGTLGSSIGGDLLTGTCLKEVN